MLALIIPIMLIMAALAGGFVALIAGRKFYALWLCLATFFFTTRILDLALIRTSATIHNLDGLVIAILVVVMIVLMRKRIIPFVLAVGGFIVSATIVERLLGIIAPEAGKFLFFAFLIGGGLIGLFLFQKILDFNDAIIVLSALWGSSFLSSVIFDILDTILISATGILRILGGSYTDFLTFLGFSRSSIHRDSLTIFLLDFLSKNDGQNHKKNLNCAKLKYPELFRGWIWIICT